MNLKGTKTLENLMKAFAGESQARNRYTFYASVAKKEGYEQIAAIFTETADNEKEHAKVFFKHILEGMASELPITVHVDADYPVELRTTRENLKAAAAGENEEWTMLYPEFADVAEKEGFKDVANSFRQIAKVENRHEARYLKLLDNIGSVKSSREKRKCCGNAGTAATFSRLRGARCMPGCDQLLRTFLRDLLRSNRTIQETRRIAAGSFRKVRLDDIK